MVIQWEKEEIVFFKADITELMRGMYNVKDFSERSADIWYSVISSSIAYDEFVSALQKYLASALGVYPPKPVNILDIALGKAKTPEEFIQEKIEEHPDPDMAWAIASRMLDERETLVITQEILNSFRMVSHMSADSIAQRKAFQSFYRKEVQQSVEQGKKPVWTISRGWDKNLWKVRIQEAVDHGFLSIEKLEDEYRMLLEHQQESKPMAKILHLIKGKSAESSTEDNEILVIFARNLPIDWSNSLQKGKPVGSVHGWQVSFWHQKTPLPESPIVASIA